MTNSPKDSMTLPAASVPEWPSTNTTLVDATLSPNLNSVAISNTDGKDENSSGLRVLRVIMTINRPSIMLNVNSTSSKNAGSGTTRSAKISSTNVGAPTLFALSHAKRSENCRKFDSMASKVLHLPLNMANYATREVIVASFVPTLHWTPSQLTGVGIIPSRFFL